MYDPLGQGNPAVAQVFLSGQPAGWALIHFSLGRSTDDWKNPYVETIETPHAVVLVEFDAEKKRKPEERAFIDYLAREGSVPELLAELSSRSFTYGSDSYRFVWLHGAQRREVARSEFSVNDL